jgi:hypothetical protein
MYLSVCAAVTQDGLKLEPSAGLRFHPTFFPLRLGSLPQVENPRFTATATMATCDNITSMLIGKAFDTFRCRK